jgi:hypothetical protein
MSVPDSREVIVPLPPQAKAPGLRDAFSTLASMRVRELAPDWLAIAPREGAGAVYEYFRLERLCDTAAPPSDETWAPLLANPPLHADEELWPDPGAGGRDLRERLRNWAEKINDPERPEAYLASTGARLTTLPLDEVSAFLTVRAREFLAVYPDASYWFMRSGELLIKRFAMLRVLLALALAPDVIDDNDPDAHNLPKLKTLQEHSLTRGSDFGELIDPLLLTFSPGSLGYVFNWMPHALVFLTGINGSLVRDYPQTPSALYLPNIQAIGSFAWKDSNWFEGIDSAHAECLLQWWVARLNVVYSYLLDPTNFDELGRHSAPRQLATLLTFERLLADLLLVQAGFQGSGLARQQAAFDLLDKAEALLGFGVSGSGQGFEQPAATGIDAHPPRRGLGAPARPAAAALPRPQPRALRRHVRARPRARLRAPPRRRRYQGRAAGRPARRPLARGLRAAARPRRPQLGTRLRRGDDERDRRDAPRPRATGHA